MDHPTCGSGRGMDRPSRGWATVTGKEFKRTLERLKVSQLGAGRLFGVDGRTVRAWVAGDARIPEAVAILVRLLLAGKITLDDVGRAKK
jgi:DNA-binding transcriptional regulator YiaG